MADRSGFGKPGPGEETKSAPSATRRFQEGSPFIILRAIMAEPKERAAGPIIAQRRKLLTPFVLVVLVALVLRLVYLDQLSASPLFEDPIMDARVHHEWAQDFAAGEEWSVDPETGAPIAYFRAPLYVWFLGTVYKFLGVDAGFTPRLIQSLLGSLSCGLIFLLGARFFSRRVGITAGLGAAACWTLVYFDNELLIVPVIVFLDLVLLLLLEAVSRNPRWWRFCAAGAVLGLSAIARPNILAVAPVALIWIVLIQRRAGAGWRGGAASSLLFLFALLLPILPVTARNMVTGDDRVLISSQGGVNFYIGNNPDSDGITAVVPGTPSDWWGGYRATRARAERALGHEPKPSEVSEYFFAEGIRFWKSSPGPALKILAAKVRYFFCRQEFANNKCLYTFTGEITPIARWLPVGFGLVAPLGLFGLIVSLLGGRSRGERKRCGLLPLSGFVLFYTLSVVVFFVTARYRMPVAAVMIIYAASGLWWLIDRIAERSFPVAAGALCVLLLLFVPVLHVPGVGFGQVYVNEGESFMTLGRAYVRQGRAAEALDSLDRAARWARTRLNSRPTGEQASHAARIASTVLFEKGTLLSGADRPAEAFDAWTEALRWTPTQTIERAVLHQRIALLLDRMGRPQEAARHRAEERKILDRLNSPRRGGR